MRWAGAVGGRGWCRPGLSDRVLVGARVDGRIRGAVIADLKFPCGRVTAILVGGGQVVAIELEGFTLAGIEGQVDREGRASRPHPLVVQIPIDEVGGGMGAVVRGCGGGPLPRELLASLEQRNLRDSDTIRIVAARCAFRDMEADVAGGSDCLLAKRQRPPIGDGDGLGGEGAIAVERVVALNGKVAGLDVLVKGDGLIDRIRAKGDIVARAKVRQSGRPIRALGRGDPGEILCLFAFLGEGGSGEEGRGEGQEGGPQTGGVGVGLMGRSFREGWRQGWRGGVPALTVILYHVPGEWRKWKSEKGKITTGTGRTRGRKREKRKEQGVQTGVSAGTG